jgi:hypothetical protein
LRTPDKEVKARLNNFIDMGDDVEEQLFVDWGDQETYSLQIGRSECAA